MTPQQADSKGVKTSREFLILGQDRDSLCDTIELHVRCGTELHAHLNVRGTRLYCNNGSDDQIWRGFQRICPCTQAVVKTLKPGHSLGCAGDELVWITRAAPGANVVWIRRNVHYASPGAVNDPYRRVIRQ